MSELRSALLKTLDSVKTDAEGHVELGDDDFYWHLQSDAAFDIGSDPSRENITTGSLADDVSTTKGIAVEAADESFVWHDLEHLIGVLRRIAYIDAHKS